MNNTPLPNASTLPNDNMTVSELAKHYGLSVNTIYAIIRDNGIKSRIAKAKTRPRTEYSLCEFRQHLKKRTIANKSPLMSVTQLRKHFRTSPEAIRGYIIDKGIISETGTRSRVRTSQGIQPQRYRLADFDNFIGYECQNNARKAGNAFLKTMQLLAKTNPTIMTKAIREMIARLGLFDNNAISEDKSSVKLIETNKHLEAELKETQQILNDTEAELKATRQILDDTEDELHQKKMEKTARRSWKTWKQLGLENIGRDEFHARMLKLDKAYKDFMPTDKSPTGYYQVWLYEPVTAFSVYQDCFDKEIL